MEVVFFLICFGASCIGAISGIGGGVIIKPMLDATGLLGVSTAHFLSGCSVLAMSSLSLVINRKNKLNLKVSLPLSLGAVGGGIFGKGIYHQATMVFDGVAIGFWQSFAMLVMNLLVLLFVLNRNKLTPLKHSSPAFSLTVGLTLGIISSFLGIGGGPLNIAVLYHFYSMQPKEAAHNSLFIVFCSQLASIFSSVLGGKIPSFTYSALVAVCLGGLLGAVIGRGMAKKISEANTTRIFIVLLIFIISLNAFNMVSFS